MLTLGPQPDLLHQNPCGQGPGIHAPPSSPGIFAYAEVGEALDSEAYPSDKACLLADARWTHSREWRHVWLWIENSDSQSVWSREPSGFLETFQRVYRLKTIVLLILTHHLPSFPHSFMGTQ